MKKLRRLLGILLIGAVLVVVGGRVGIALMWKSALENYGSKITEVPVTVGKVWISPFQGTIQIDSLEIGNPDGFKSARALIARRIDLKLEWKSLFGKKVILRDLSVRGMNVTYERALLRSNLGVISKTVQAKSKAPEKLGDKLKRGIQVDQVSMTDGTVNLSATLLGGRGISVSLPALRLQDLGAEPAGITVAELVSELLRALLENVVTLSSPGQTNE